MRATTLVKFDATHQVKYNPPLTRAVHFTAKQFHNNRRLLFHSPQGEFHRKKVFVKMTKTFFLMEQGCLRMNTPLKLRFRFQMPFLYHPAGHVPVHFKNNRVQLLQWLLPLYSMRKQSVYDFDK